MQRTSMFSAGSLLALAADRCFVLVVVAALAVGCASSGSIYVRSEPAGARILVDGADSGLTTPSRVELATGATPVVIEVRKAGYNPVSRTVRYETEVDPITPSEAATTILCSPCCLGLPLLSFLEPLRVESRFVPAEIDARLEPAGQGIRLTVRPEHAELRVDGVRVRPFTGNLYALEHGEHQLEFVADGYRTFAQRLDVRPAIYHELSVTLELDGAGVIVLRPRRGSSKDGVVEIHVDGALHATAFDRPLRLEPGQHRVMVIVPGFEPWTADVQVAPQGFLEIRPALVRPPAPPADGEHGESGGARREDEARDL